MTDLLRPVPRKVPVGRYAPSPTGTLHLGNLRTALLAWMDIRSRGGLFILRIEDIDAPRTVPGAEQGIVEDLRWLGIDWDEGPGVDGPAGSCRQSERGEIYQAAFDRLADRGLLYPCICSRKDLKEASAPHGDEGPIYPGTCRGRAMRSLKPMEAAVRLRTDRPPLNGPIHYDDLFMGRLEFNLSSLSGDFVVLRRDGLWAYQLACAVDDAVMGVTHVIRGADLVTSTPRQLAIMRALGLPEPRYGHIPLVHDAAGERMSKRDGSAGLAAWRAEGVSAGEARKRLLALPVSSSVHGTM